MVVSQFLMSTLSDCLPCILCLSVVMERVPETWRGAEREADECIGLAVCFLARIRAYKMLKLLFRVFKMYDCVDFRNLADM